jgi:hypothetical protein
MPPQYAFFCVVPWAGHISVSTRDIDLTAVEDGNHPFQKQQFKVPVDGHEVLGKIYFARPVRDSEWPTIRQLVVDTLKPKRVANPDQRR